MTNSKNSIWLGSGMPAAGRAEWKPNANTELRELITTLKCPLLVIGRNSNSSGKRGADDAVRDLEEACAELAKLHGFDVRSLLPPREELVGMLMASPNVVTSVDRDGRKFKNRYMLIDASEHGVIFSLSAGSARKVDAEWNQPHVSWVQNLLREVEPVGFFAKVFDRVSRVVFQTGLVVQELRSLEKLRGRDAWAYDMDGRWSTAHDAAVILALKGQQAEEYARRLRNNTIRGVTGLSGSVMVQGKVPFAMANGIPAGLFVYRDRVTDNSVLAIDTPNNYPDRDSTLYGLPNVRYDDGTLVDQADTVCWFLREYAKPGVTVRDLFPGLLARRFSTQGLRSKRVHGPTAYYGGPTQRVEDYKHNACVAWTRSLMSNLEFYESGVLTRRFGPESEAEVSASNVFPPSGAWASAQEFAQIKIKRAEDASVFSQRRRWSWSRMPILLDGQPATLFPKDGRISDEDAGWVIRLDEVPSEGDAQRRRPWVPPIPDSDFTAAIVDAVWAANGLPLQRFIDEDRVPEASTAEVERLLASVEAGMTAKRDGLNRRYELLMETDPNKALKGGLIKRVQDEYVKLEAELQQLDAERLGLQRRLESMRVTRPGVDVTALSALLEGMMDPEANDYRDVLREAVRGLTATTTRRQVQSLVGVEVEVCGLLVVEAEGGPYSIPFKLSYADGAAVDHEQRGVRALARLRQGQVARHVGAGKVQASTKLAAEVLGVNPKKFGLGVCHDPKLLRLGMATLFPDPAQGEDPAVVVSVDELAADPGYVSDFGEVQTLAGRIRKVYSEQRGSQWLTNAGGRYETLALVRSATGRSGLPADDEAEATSVKHFIYNLKRNRRAHRWQLPPKVWPTLVPCQFCGKSVCVSMRFRECDGYLCLGCRRDEAGVRWPSRFDQYVSHMDLWTEAEFDFDLPDGFSGHRLDLQGDPVNLVAPRKRKWRSLDELDEESCAAIVTEYSGRMDTVENIARRHRVDLPTVFAIAAKNGLTPRRPTLASWVV